MKSHPFELNLRHLSMVEHHIASEEYYSRYAGAVAMMLSFKDQHQWEDELLNTNGKQTMEELHAENPVRFFKAEYTERDRKTVNSWYDTWADYLISPDDQLYSLFFAYKIKHLDLLDMDGFFDYQLAENYDNDFSKFSRFLTLTMRKYVDALLEKEHELTMQEWISNQQKEIEQQGQPAKIKGRPVRSAEDQLTGLNQEQTVLFIHYLQQARVILKEDYLSNKLAGQAFHILTGYSADTIRQKLNPVELNQIAQKKNLTELDNLLTRIRVQISRDLKEKT